MSEAHQLIALIYLFTLCDSSQVAETNIGTLHYAFEEHFVQDYGTFYNFLNAVFNKNLIIPRQILEQGQVKVFKLDKAVALTYKNDSLNSFLERYCCPNKVGGYRLNKINQSPDAMKSVLYYLFLNNFKIKIIDSEDSFSIVPNEDKV